MCMPLIDSVLGISLFMSSSGGSHADGQHSTPTGGPQRLLSFWSFFAHLDRLVRSLPPDREIAILWIDILNLRREFSLWGVSAAQG